MSRRMPEIKRVPLQNLVKEYTECGERGKGEKLQMTT